MLNNVSDADLNEIVKNENISNDLRICALRVLTSRDTEQRKEFQPASTVALDEINFKQAIMSPALMGQMIEILSNRLGPPTLYGKGNRTGGLLNISYQTLIRWKNKNFEDIHYKHVARMVGAYNMIRQWSDNSSSSSEIVEKFKHMWHECISGEDAQRRSKLRTYFGVY